MVSPLSLSSPSPMDCQLTEIITALVTSYNDIGGINHVGCGGPLPSKRDIAGLCDELLHLLFPGFFAEEAVAFADLEMLTSEKIASVRHRLCAEITRSLSLKGAVGGLDVSALVCRFLLQLPRTRERLHLDVQAAFDGDPAARSTEEIILAYPGLEAIAIQRLAHILYLDHVPLIPRMMTEWAHGRTGIDIHPGAQIGTHFFIDHGTGVVIGETAKIGNHVKLYQGVGLVARSLAAGQKLRDQKRHPTLEDHVTIYANATIVGGDTIIGTGATIGASVFLMQSVPAGQVITLGEQELRVLERKVR